MQVSELQQSLTVAHAEAEGLRGRSAATDSLQADPDTLTDDELRYDPAEEHIADKCAAWRFICWLRLFNHQQSIK